MNGRHIEIVIRINDLNPTTACLMSLGLINRAHHLLTSISVFKKCEPFLKSILNFFEYYFVSTFWFFFLAARYLGS